MNDELLRTSRVVGGMSFMALIHSQQAAYELKSKNR
jgi:hypothetical protein